MSMPLLDPAYLNYFPLALLVVAAGLAALGSFQAAQGADSDATSGSYARKPDIPAWSNPALEDHKGNRLTERMTPEMFATGLKTFFGDVHIHTNYSRCGRPNNMDLPDKIAYARDKAGLDFAAFADHIEHMDDAQYAEYCRQIESANQNGRFVTLPTYEWAGRGHITCGHRNVMFRDAFGPAFRGTEEKTNTVQKLHAALAGARQPVMTPRHHTTYQNSWNNFNQAFEPVVEIYSSWGSSECQGGPRQRADTDDGKPMLPGNYVADGLTRGNMMGFISGSDGHNIMPGSCGLTAAVVPELTRSAVWDAIHARRCYATTGSRILLDFTVNGYPMGTVLRAPQARWAEVFPLKIACAAVGTAKLDTIELIENNRLIYTHTIRRGPANEMAFCVHKKDMTYFARYYYVRLTQCDGEMAWSSPIWILFEDEPR